MIKTFDLLASNIENLELKLDGKLPVNRDELLALVNTWGRMYDFYSYDKDNNEIEILHCYKKDEYNLSNLDVSEITNFNDIFYYSDFEGDINNWDVSKATSMEYMFKRTKFFDFPLNSWDVSNVTNMYAMFYYAKGFNQPLNNWNTYKVKSMSYMFANTQNFNQPLDKWNTSKVTDMSLMFYETEKFNQNLNSWDVSKVKYMNSIFADSKKFNQPILWDLSKVENCTFIFEKAISFKNRFNEGKDFPINNRAMKNWLKENRYRMIALDIENSKGKELDNFLLNINNKKDLNKL